MACLAVTGLPGARSIVRRVDPEWPAGPAGSESRRREARAMTEGREGHLAPACRPGPASRRAGRARSAMTVGLKGRGCRRAVAEYSAARADPTAGSACRVEGMAIPA